jgi:hypothetical protein
VPAVATRAADARPQILRVEGLGPPRRAGTTDALSEAMNKTAKRSPENGSPVPRDLTTAKQTPDIVSVPHRRCLAIDGVGSPQAPQFQQAVEALYGVGYALKFARKKAGDGDFKIGPLESHWSAVSSWRGDGKPPPEAWHWRVRIGVPAEVTRDQVERIKREVVVKKGGKLQGSAVVPHVFLESIPNQRLGRVLHVGPYADEEKSFALIAAALEHAGLTPAPTHIEVYRNDPRRTRPEALETVLLRELAAH